MRAVNHSLRVSLERSGTMWSVSCSAERQRATVWIDSNAFSRTWGREREGGGREGVTEREMVVQAMLTA